MYVDKNREIHFRRTRSRKKLRVYRKLLKGTPPKAKEWTLKVMSKPVLASNSTCPKTPAFNAFDHGFKPLDNTARSNHYWFTNYFR